MTAQQIKLIAIAGSEIGYLEKASYAHLDDKTANAGSANYTKYGEWYGLNGQPWCAMFVSWCFDQAGLADIAPKYAGCYAGVSWFRNHGTFHGKAAYTPQPGDVIFFSSAAYPSGGAHTGIVTECDGEIVRTIEGNTSGGSTLIANGGCVAAKAYTLDYAPIYGYGTPLWPDEPDPDPDPEQEDDDMLTYEQFTEYMERYRKDLQAKEGSAYSEAARTWATENGIFRGGLDGSMMWQDTLSREQLATVLYRLAHADDGK